MTPSSNLTPRGTVMQHLVGENVRRFRTRLGLTVDDLAARISSEPDTVTWIENGDVNIDIDQLVDLADALGVGAHVLVASEAESEAGENAP